MKKIVGMSQDVFHDQNDSEIDKLLNRIYPKSDEAHFGRSQAKNNLIQLISLKLPDSGSKLHIFLQTLTTIFGFGGDIPNDSDRWRAFIHTGIPALIDSKNKGCLDEIRRILPTFGNNFTASGRHRLYPAGIAVVNMINGRSVTDISWLPKDSDQYLYMTENHPTTFSEDPSMCGNFDGSGVRIPLSINPGDVWLDIGSAPKTEGPPSLIGLRETLALDSAVPKLHWQAVDILFPHFRLNGKTIAYSDYVDPLDGQVCVKSSVEVGGIQCCNGFKPEFSVYNDAFDRAPKVKFLTLARTFHHLTGKDDPKSKTWQRFTDRKIIDQHGTEMTDTKLALPIVPAQRMVMNRLLDRLAIGGLFIGELEPFHSPWINDNILTIIRRVDESTFQLYDQTPINYRPERDTYTPIDRFIRPNTPTEIKFLLYAAQYAVFRNLGWKKSYWGAEDRVQQKIAEWFSGQRVETLSDDQYKAVIQPEKLRKWLGEFMFFVPENQKQAILDKIPQ